MNEHKENKNTKKKKVECRVSSLCRVVGPLAAPKNLFSRQKQNVSVPPLLDDFHDHAPLG